jgi:hypothetical protein
MALRSIVGLLLGCEDGVDGGPFKVDKVGLKRYGASFNRWIVTRMRGFRRWRTF